MNIPTLVRTRGHSSKVKLRPIKTTVILRVENGWIQGELHFQTRYTFDMKRRVKFVAFADGGERVRQNTEGVEANIIASRHRIMVYRHLRHWVVGVDMVLLLMKHITGFL